MLTKKQKKKYLDGGGVHCPFCDSNDIEGGSFQCEGEISWQSVSCLSCGKSWDDIYKLINMEEEE